MTARLIACYSASVLALLAQPTSRKDDKLRKELSSGFRTWIEQDVAYIITGPEREAFHRLQNDEEREQFVEQFWLRRDPTPDTAENEFKEEHYRRIAFANERYGSGVPGWKTDRGRIYITHGPPDEIEAHPSGGSYQRPPEQGGGTTSTYPFETWRYRYIEGIGNDVIVEFVDTTMTGEYRMAFDPSEKDALTHLTPGLPSANTGSGQANSRTFDRIETISKLSRPPDVRFKDLEALVASTIRYNLLPMKVQADFLRMTESTVSTPVTIQFENRDLQFKQENGFERATVNLYMRVTSLAGRVVRTEEDVLTVDSPAGMRRTETSVYQKTFFLAPGTYRLNVVAKDVTGGNTNNVELALRVPQFEAGKLSTSSLILADLIEKVPTRMVNAGQFVLGDSKVRPRVSASFGRNEKMGVYFQVYGITGGSVAYQVLKSGSTIPTLDFVEDVGPSVEQITIEKLLPMANFEPGEYTLKIVITDRDRKQIALTPAAFSVR